MASAITELTVRGMSCTNCARHVTEAIQAVAGVRSATVNLEQNRAVVRWVENGPAQVAAVIGAVQGAGYEAQEIQPTAHDHPKEQAERRLAGWQLNLWIGVLGTIPLMLGEWVFGLGIARWFQWVAFFLAGVVQVFSGAQFYRGAWRQIRVGSSNMDTLVALGSTTAFGYSVWALLTGTGGHLYFMEAAAIITVVSLGHWLESRVSARASGALQKLLHLAPNKARKVHEDGQEEEVAVATLNIGDKIALRPGDRVPTDGEVVEGESSVEEAMLTGESVPVDKKAGEPVYAGTVNLNGRLTIRVTATGEETALAHIIEAVQRAQSSRAEIQRLGDRVSSVFVPVVVGIALAAGLWWGLAPESAHQVHGWLGQFLWHAHPPVGVAAAFIIAAGVLIIACPCAMGLATPAAIMAASNAAAQRGILVRDGVALEQAGRVTAVLFDKTGTLTTGKPSVADVWTREQESQTARGVSPVLEMALALAQHSNHPMSRAVGDYAKREGRTRPAETFAAQITEWQEVPGGGVAAKIQERNSKIQNRVQLGSLRWLAESGVEWDSGRSFVEKRSQEGATIVGFAIEKKLLALFAVKDTMKFGVPKVVERLKEQGFKVCLVTGDNALTAASIAKQAGIETAHVFAEVRPEQKADIVKKLQRNGEQVAFVGDGINDAPAIEQADLGIAVSRASDIAREAADIILLNSEIEAVPESLALARATLRTIKQNLFWAFFYNALGVPLAALGFMSPVLCAAAMGFSDFVVIGNALRLRNAARN
jgi:Cu+-exporting ATPase